MQQVEKVVSSLIMFQLTIFIFFLKCHSIQKNFFKNKAISNEFYHHHTQKRETLFVFFHRIMDH